MAFDESALNDLMRQSEERLRSVEQIREQMAVQTGQGTSASGLVTATVAADGKVSELQLDPRIMRTSSYQIAEEVTEAVNQAIDDLRARTAELMRPLGSIEDLLDSSSSATEEIRQYGEQVNARLNGVLAELERLRRR